MKVTASLDLLRPTFRMEVEGLLEDLAQAGFRPRVFETGRSDARQAELVRLGASRRVRSKHQDGRAADIIDATAGWKSKPFFDALASCAERRGLVSGHRWRWRDSAHVEMPG